MSTTPASRLLRRARRILSFGAVGLLAFPLVGWADAVAVEVDGERLTARTYAATVGDILAQLDVPVGPADAVSPAPDEAVEDGLEIDVQRAITVDVVLDGQLNRRVTAPAASVAGVLTAADLDVREHDGQTVPSWNAEVEDGDEIHVQLPRSVSIEVDGETREVLSSVSTVGDLLAEEGVALGDDDVVDWSLDAPVQPHSSIAVSRVTHEELVEEVVLDHGEERRETDDLERGETRVEAEGRDGLREDTYRVEMVDGEEVDRELIDEEVVREAEDRVVLVGTADPAPEPEPDPAPSRSSSSSSSSSSSGSSGSASSSSSSSSSSSPSAPSTASGSTWDRLAQCESGGNWSINTGNGYYGGLQFSLQSWRAVGGSGYPHEASRETQIAMAERLKAKQGWGAWPACSSKLGLR